MTEAQDSGVRLYTISAFKHLKSRSILYRPRVSREELMNVLYDVLPQADVVSIRRVDAEEDEEPATDAQIRRMERESKEKGIPLPEGYKKFSKRAASAWITAAAKKSPQGGGGASVR